MPETARKPALAAPLPAPLMETKGLSFSAGGAKLIDDVSLTVRAGRRLAVLGANGAGKSLLLRLLHGLIGPDSGAISWRGRPLDAAARRAQAMVFQRPVLLRRSVLANLLFALRVQGFDAAERARRAEEALAEARLDRLARRPARVLSGGEQQRLALARAMACGPELLFLDEPTASLDPASTFAIETLIDRAHARGASIVLVTHDIGQARRLADDVVFLHAGRVAESGPASRVLEAPRAAPVRAWLEGRLYFNGVESAPTTKGPET